LSNSFRKIDEKILKNLSDPAWRLSNLYSIVDKQANQVPFVENSIQRHLNNTLSKRKIILKARQFGISTNEILKQFDFVCWNKNATACILAHEKDAIEKLFRIVRRAWDFMDPQLRPDIDRGEGSKYALYFPKRNSRIYCDLESRGDTIHWLHISESAFLDNPEKVLATLQAVPLNGTITFETTPNAMNWFYDYWQDDNGFTKLFYPWYLHEEYQIATDPLELTDDELKLKAYALEQYQAILTDAQIAFRRHKQKELKHLFIQEFPEDPVSCFLSSGESAMDLKKLHEILMQCPKPISDDDGVKVYEKRNSMSRYVIGADTAEGVDGDYSVGVVMQVRPMRTAAVLRGRWKPHEFAHRLYALAKLYMKGQSLPMLAVERNNHGHSVISELENHIRYPSLYQAEDEKMGWLTNLVTRPLMMNTFVEGVESSNITLLDETTVKECLTLVYNNGKIEAGTSRYDDCIIATAIAVQMCIQAGELDLYDNIESMIRV
jgi:hypothetical protein